MSESAGAIALDIVMGKNTVAGVVGDAMKECQSVVSNASSGVSAKVNAIGSACTSVGAAMAPVSLAVAGVGTAAFKSASTFEDSMAKVSTIADNTQVPMGDLEKAILGLSDQTGISANVIADNVYNAISAGQSTGDAVNFVSNSTKLATAGFADAGDSLDILTTILNSYGLEADKVTNVSDMLIQTQNLGKTTVAELSSSMGKVIPTANAYGVGLDNVCTGYALMTANGVATAESTTYMNSMLNELGKSGTKVSDILQARTGQSFKELMDGGASLGDVLAILQSDCNETGTQFSDLWSSAEAGKAALILAKDGADGFNGTLGEMQNSAGATDTAFEKMQTTSWTMQQALNEMKNVFIDLGGVLMETLAPIIQSACDKIKEFKEWFSGLDEGTKQTIVSVGLFVVALAPVLLGVGKVAGGISSLMTLGGQLGGVFSTLAGSTSGLGAVLGGLSAPILAIIAAVGLCVAAFVHLWNTNEEFRTKVTEIWNGIKEKWNEFTQGITERLNALGFDFEDFSEVVSAIWNGFCDILAPAFEFAFGLVSTIFGAGLDFITGVLDVFIGLFTGNWSQLWQGVQEIFGSFAELVQGLFSGFTQYIVDAFNVFLGWFGTSWQDLWSGVSSFFSDIWNSITTFFSDILTNIGEFVSNKTTEIHDTFVSVFTAVHDFFSGLWTTISNVFSDAWNFILSTISNACTSAQNTAVNIWNAISGAIGNILGSIKNTIADIWNSIVSTISNACTSAKDTAVNIWNSISGYIGGIVSNIYNSISSTFHNVVSGISSALSGVYGAVTGGFSSAINYITGLPGRALEWGKDFIGGLIDGIQGMIGDVVDAVSDVADTISSYLHFSVPDEGPLTEYESWMPDFMQGLAQGIKGNAGLVTGALDGLTSDMSVNPNLSVNAPALRNTTSTSDNSSDKMDALIDMMRKFIDKYASDSGDWTFPLYVGGDFIDELLVKREDRKTIRSGGRA